MSPRIAVGIGIVWLGAVGCGRPALQVERLETPVAGAGAHSADPALGVDPGSGELVMGWVEGDGKVWTLYASRSADAGGTWSSPVKVAGGAESPEEVHPHGESSPRLVIAPGNRRALIWPNSVTVPGRKWPATLLRFSRSQDGGQTWSAPTTLNDDTTAAPVSHQFHGAAWVGDSGIAVAWLDERDVAAPVAAGAEGHTEHASEPDATIYYTTSEDFGRSWAPNRAGWKEACPCCRVTLARDRNGEAVAAWRKHYPGDVRDVVTTLLSDEAAQPERVHQDDWAYPGCPHTGPAIATGADGSSHVVWYNGKAGSAGVYYAKVTASGERSRPVGLVTGTRVGAAHAAVEPLGDGGALTAYDLTENGDRRISVARVLAAGSLGERLEVPGSEGGKYPQLAVLGDTTAVVAWTATLGDRSELRLARIDPR
ncbi:MAG: exo-alpha-sialidase [Gemmatimonadales bacterium]|nr:exo-alpha-sialidase [Gemmatimonadales bacterium]